MTNTTATQVIQLVAPCDLDGGYLLDVELGGEIRTVLVPEYGVFTGETFSATLLPLHETSVPIEAALPASDCDDPQIPTGQWRDGLCDCCSNVAPSCCMCYFCAPILLSQVMTRSRLTWCCAHGQPPNQSHTCIIMSSLFLVLEAIWTILAIAIVAQLVECSNKCAEINAHSSNSYCYMTFGSRNLRYTTYTHYVYEPCLSYGLSITIFVMLLPTMAYSIHCIVALCQTRRRLRTKDQIPESCGGCEDCCVSYWCFRCAVAQMARHTNNYHDYPVSCCSGDCFNNTGQNADARALLV